MEKKPETGLHDSLIRRYVTLVDSFDFFDTTEYNFRLLKAYINKDSSFLKGVSHDMWVASTYDVPRFDTCVSPKKISDLPVDEAYRFTHRQSFCLFGQTITITKKEDSASVQFVEYLLPAVHGFRQEITLNDGTHYVMQDNCVKIREVVKELSKKEWESLEQKLDDADYWGLNTRNMKSGFDGSDWVIDGYIKNPGWNKKNIHKVIRWTPENSFMALGQEFLRLSGQTTMCGEMH